VQFPGSMPNRMNKKTTIKHIAETSGFSFSTVAKALKNDSVIRAETRASIQKIADDLNYYPNRLARGLRSSATRTVGVILNDVKNPFYAEIYGVIEDVLNRRDYTMLLCDSSFDTTLEKKNILAMLSHGVDGLIVSPLDEASQNLDLLATHGVRAVILDCKPQNASLSYVYPNHEMAASLAVNHLIENGHRDILLLNGPEGLSSSRRFLAGYQSTLEKQGIPLRPELIIHTQISPEHASACITEILAGTFSSGGRRLRPNDFTAVVTLSDLLALGVYKSVKAARLSIPDDYSVVGYDNIFATEYVCPPLTTINQPKKETGLFSIELLLRAIKNPNMPPENLVLNPHLIDRDSVKRIV
jgi:LacI family transcriptional regulator